MLFLLSLFSIFGGHFWKKLELRELSLSRAQLCPPECRLSWVDRIWAHLSWSFPSPVRATVHLPQLPPDPSTFLNSCSALHEHRHPRAPLLPSFLASCLPWLFPLPWTLFSFSSLTVISLLPLISLAASVLSCSALPCFLLSASVIFAPDPPSPLFLALRDVCFYL